MALRAETTAVVEGVACGADQITGTEDTATTFEVALRGGVAAASGEATSELPSCCSWRSNLGTAIS
jgi:hypothetical protein